MSPLKPTFSSSALNSEEHRVITERDKPTGTVTHEEWRKDGKLDRADGPAWIVRDKATGVTYEEWWKDGKLDRADGPAWIVRDKATGTVTREAWWKDGKLDRADGPAGIVRDKATGAVTHEEWRKDGKLDRADGPAWIVRDKATGAVTREAWWKGGSRVDPPSPVASEQDEILSLAAEFKTAVAAFGDRLEALSRKMVQKGVTPAPR